VGIRVLVTGAGFTLNPGDKTGLVGRNGAGKTTLLRVLAGERPADTGRIGRRGVIGYLSQETELPNVDSPDATTLERILTARSIGDVQRRMERTRLAMEDAEGAERERLIRRFARIETEFETLGGYAAEAEAKRFASSVGIGNDELNRPIRTMSGGERRRVELARVLFADTDILLLDEPTNHLDLDAKAWMMGFLASYRGALLVVSHDLPLLDESITSVLSLESGHLEAYRGNYSFYMAERHRRREQRIKQRRHQQEQIDRLEFNIRRFKHTTEKMAKRARSWETRVARLRGELVAVEKRGRGVGVRFPQPEPSGRTPIRAGGLAKAFGDNVVFVEVNVDTSRGERMLIMGLNGAGKTTLLRILAGVETPDLGDVQLGHRTSVGYYAQEHEQIVAGAAVLDHLRAVSDAPDRTLRGVLGHFLLADKIDQDSATLSGGEKTKLALAQLVVGRHNLLLLDEPTNNLDPQAKEALLGALERYSGTIVLVSHDTDFVAKLDPDRALMMPDGDTVYFDAGMLELVALT
ncbi:MAG: ABC-F family ATP-binding cassette domain-containing protein, partial [Acidimicrobiia bacterium]